MRRPQILPLILGLSLCGCSDAVDPPSDGILAVSTSTSGDDPDPDGFQLTIDGIDSLALLPSGTAELDLSPGRHTLQLRGVAEHCSVFPGTSVEVDIVAGRTAPVAFQVSCPGTSISVTVTTTGPAPDPDGYQLTIDGVDALALNPTGTAQVNVAHGRHTLQLRGVAEHCSVTPGTVLELEFARGSTTPVAFVVVCPAELSGFIWGQVLDGSVDGSGLCIRGAMVEIVAGPGMGRKSDQPDTCNAWDYDGFRFNDLPLGATVTLRATASGYQPEERDVVAFNSGGPVQFVLQPNAAFEGRIAFESSGDIYVMDADGSNPVNLTQTGSNNFGPAWSPDGTRIAFLGRYYDIWVMNADGSNPVRLTFGYGQSTLDGEPAWSPDGTRIAFTSRGRIYVMNADGSNVVNLSDVILSNISEYVYHPYFLSLAWSPDGTRIALSLSEDICCADIYVANADGSNPRNLTPRSVSIDDRSPAWSPDGRRIAHSRRAAPGGTADIYVMDADGSDGANLSNNTASDREPAWSPDGTRIAFASDREDDFDIYVMDADGANLIRLADRTGSDRHPAWAP